MRIYNTNTELPYTQTAKSPESSQRDINATLAHYGITKVFWHFDLPGNKVELAFQFSSKFMNADIPELMVRIKPPTIWKKIGRGYDKKEVIDWKTSLRILHWYLKNKLAMTFAMQSSPIAAFLSHIVVRDGKTTVGELVVPQLSSKEAVKALPHFSFVASAEP